MMNKQEFITAWLNATPETREAVETILKLTTAGIPTEQAIEAVKDKGIREDMLLFHARIKEGMA